MVAFYDLMFNKSRPREAIERYAVAEYVQHNPGVADGKQGFIDYFEEAARDYPGPAIIPGSESTSSGWTTTARS